MSKKPRHIIYTHHSGGRIIFRRDADGHTTTIVSPRSNGKINVPISYWVAVLTVWRHWGDTSKLELPA